MVATKPVDFRKGAEGLATLVRETMTADPFSGAVYVFRAKRAHPGLDRAERMLDRLAPLAHLLRMLVEPALYCLENMLMLPTADPTLLARGAAVLDGAALANIGRVAVQNQSIFLGCEGLGEPFTGRTNVNVLLHEVAEVLLAEAPFRL
jgi:hypothetical protein